MRLLRSLRRLGKKVDALTFAAPVTHVYNPYAYARRGLEAYVKSFAGARPEALLLGMNPGPFGMAQTGVPFGDPERVRTWMGLDARVEQPAVLHPKRPVLGFASPRQEGSGKRLWGWAESRFGEPRRFFEKLFILNYCPLCFMVESGKNRTPDQLPASERARLFEVCDQALREAVDILVPRQVIGIGKFAERRAREALADRDLPVGVILHPSPANPAANRDWVGIIEKQLVEQGVRLGR